MRLALEIIRQAGARTLLGESPCWDPVTHDVWWVDIEGKRLLFLDRSSGRIDSWDLPEHPGFVVLLASGRPALGLERGIFAFDPETGGLARLVSFDRPGQRFNDAAVDGSGRLWASTMALDAEADTGAIHLVTPDLMLQMIVKNLRIPNGLAADLKRDRLFYSDSHPGVRRVWIRRIAGKPASGGDAAAYVDGDQLGGRPDGAALDTHGNYWIAAADGARLGVFDPDGRLATVLPMPFASPSKPAFGGADGRSIAITSKAIGEEGGYLALADLPADMPAGIVQPFWVPHA
ncbi:hypothetical protein CSC94_08700 [Zhengella mangrovi]|uniref:SMP-30/Gluconolactonase/LRE-like region domain-containing protein n=1 Tax=Zhengella mangrovi TaxID=1982044 RepID=A0A2G1QQJ1_9HYPH|nr:SMP-30/gluconolactonase/LRE family protein [Zhengella mangrovi]PHP67755.1 hypothetical protein CSC94_08700 [Zhengella mangrovi]